MFPEFRLIPEAQYQLLTPEKRVDYMTRLKVDLDEQLARSALESQRFADGLKASLRKNIRPRLHLR